MPSDALTLTTGSRLHLGLFSEPWEAGRLHRGIGVMIQHPGCTIEWGEQSSSGQLSLIGFGEDESTVKKFVQSLLQRRMSTNSLSLAGGELRLMHSIPRHVGLGSGTQLALAIVSLLFPDRFQDRDVTTLTQLANRAKRSSIGAHGFFQGGAFVDQGKPADSQLRVAPVTRFELPPQWRFVLMTPQQTVGLSGVAETSAFAELDPMSITQAQRASDLCDAIPAVASSFKEFSQLVTEFGELVGSSFQAVQGGIYSWPQAQMWKTRLAKLGVTGFGQSSWGPTVFALCEDERHAMRVCETITQEAGCTQLKLQTVAPLNSGATLTELTQSTQRI